MLIFYEILPLIVITFSLLFLEVIIDRKERMKYSKDVKYMDKKLDKSRMRKLFDIFSMLAIIITIIVLFSLFVLSI